MIKYKINDFDVEPIKAEKVENHIIKISKVKNKITKKTYYRCGCMLRTSHKYKKNALEEMKFLVTLINKIRNKK